ncbi:SGNH/GDSL hydrolase family protein [Sphingomonas sp. FW199]|uniref:SGNH/GDSL hydrolase family protein n=1 Tax=Sphingomonas sp. FW199 TaxID=3400217 RepID=UPI003CECBCC0
MLPYSASIRVAFVGASITQGAEGNSWLWSSQTAAWLRAQYRGVEVRDLALSSTNSQFGTYRIEGDLGSFVPDLALVEFAVNDFPESEAFRIAYTDALIYKLRRANPNVVIVYVAAANALDGTTRLTGGTPAHIRQIRDVVQRNSAHFVDAGIPLWDQVRTSGGSVFTYLPDGIHPNEAGSNLYFGAVRDGLAAYLPVARSGPTTTSYIAQSNLQDARLLPASAATATGCTIGNQSSQNSYRLFAQAMTCQGGNSFTVDFTGTSIGFAYGIGRDTGSMDCRVDNNTARPITLYDGKFVGPGLFLLHQLSFTGLSDGAHRLSCTVSTTRPTANGATSAGTRAVIAGFAVSRERPVAP